MKTAKTPIVMLAFCLLATSGLVAADDDVDAQPIAPASNQRVQEAIDQRSDTIVRPKVICKRESQVGTHFRHTVCRTISQIEDGRADAEQFLRDEERVQSFGRDTNFSTLPAVDIVDRGTDG